MPPDRRVAADRGEHWKERRRHRRRTCAVTATARRRNDISKRRQPEQQQAPVVQRIRIRYAKRGRLRFTSHRDFARALERGVRRATVPIAFSSGFSPHPRISYASASPTGAASEAEYAELALATAVDPDWLRQALDDALPPGIDILDAVEAHTSGFAARIDCSHWLVELPGIAPDELERAVAAFLAAAEVPVERLTKNGMRTFDARGPVVRAAAARPTSAGDSPCAILDLVVRHVTPSVRPDDVLAALRVLADLEPPVPPRAIRLAQGTLTAQGELVDPLSADRDVAFTGAPSQTTAQTS